MPCVARKEDNYFFALSKYQKPLEEVLSQNPRFVQPPYRLNEVREHSLPLTHSSSTCEPLVITHYAEYLKDLVLEESLAHSVLILFFLIGANLDKEWIKGFFNFSSISRLGDSCS